MDVEMQAVVDAAFALVDETVFDPAGVEPWENFIALEWAVRQLRNKGI